MKHELLRTERLESQTGPARTLCTCGWTGQWWATGQLDAELEFIHHVGNS